MHLEIIINHNSNSLRVDLWERGKVISKGDTIPCDRTSNTIRILHEVFNKMQESGLFDLDSNNSVEITGINEESVKNEGGW